MFYHYDNNNITKIMTIKEDVYQRLKVDRALRKKIITKMKIRESNMINWIYRKSHYKIGHYYVIKIIKEHTGLTENEIFKID